MRRRLEHQGFGADHGFRWRGGDISRLEGLSDAVFAFAVCFTILFWVWHDHYRFFRRYGLADGYTTTLTGVLLFIVLFYVYPMKFLFSILFDQLFGDAPAGAIEPGQVPLLMLVYGAGFIAVQLVLILTSIAIVAVGGPDAAFWSGMAYMLIMPLQVVNGRMMGGRIRQASTTSPQP